MTELLSDEAIRMLNEMAAERATARESAAVDEQARADAEAAVAAERARLQPHEDAIQSAARQLDADLQAVRATKAWQAAQQAVLEAHAVLSAEKVAGPARDQVSEAYEAAIATRDALTAKAFSDHDTRVAKPLANLDMELAAIAVEKGEG